MKKSHTIAFQLLDYTVYKVKMKTIHSGNQQLLSYSCSIERNKRLFENLYTVRRGPSKVVPAVDSPYLEAIALTNGLWQELKLVIDTRGVICDIVNFKAIQQYGKEILQLQLSTLFSGTSINQLSIAVAKLLEDKTYFLQRIEADLFFLFWLRKSYGTYYWCDSREKYIKVNSRGQHCNKREYEIEKTASQGLLIKGIGLKSAKELQQLQAKWEIVENQTLSYSESIVYELNKQGELVYLHWEEAYRCEQVIYRADTITIRKTE